MHATKLGDLHFQEMRSACEALLAKQKPAAWTLFRTISANTQNRDVLAQGPYQDTAIKKRETVLEYFAIARRPGT